MKLGKFYTFHRQHFSKKKFLRLTYLEMHMAWVSQSILTLRTAFFILCRKNIILATKISMNKIKSVAKYKRNTRFISSEYFR